MIYFPRVGTSVQGGWPEVPLREWTQGIEKKLRDFRSLCWLPETIFRAGRASLRRSRAQRMPPAPKQREWLLVAAVWAEWEAEGSCLAFQTCPSSPENTWRLGPGVNLCKSQTRAAVRSHWCPGWVPPSILLPSLVALRV